jgi:hypothetical protein
MSFDPLHLSPQGRALLSRRNFLHQAGLTLGGVGLAKLLAMDGLLAADTGRPAAASGPIRPDIDPRRPR